MKYDIMFLADCDLSKKNGNAWGGTETTLDLVVNYLAKQGVKIAVVSFIEKNYQENGIDYLTLINWLKPTIIKIFVRQFIVSPLERSTCDIAYAWLHDYSDATKVRAYCGRIFNSNFLKKHIQTTEKHENDTVIWNPVNPKVKEFRKKKRKNYLLWNSAFSKDLGGALKIYISLHDEFKMTRTLKVCVPRWSDEKFPYPDLLEKYPIEFLGSLSWEENIELLSNAACLFKPGLFPETFGLVYAEANYLGVPVVTLDKGSSKEVLVEKNNLILDGDTSIENTLDWLEDIENVQTTFRKNYLLENVGNNWMELINKYV